MRRTQGRWRTLALTAAAAPLASCADRRAQLPARATELNAGSIELTRATTLRELQRQGFSKRRNLVVDLGYGGPTEILEGLPTASRGPGGGGRGAGFGG